jgi:hypothetical protein
LEQEEGLIHGHTANITRYCKKLFGSTDCNNISLNELYCDDIPQLTTEENAMLVAPFLEDEVRVAINQMNYNTTPSPNDFPP